MAGKEKKLYLNYDNVLFKVEALEEGTSSCEAVGLAGKEKKGYLK